MALRSRPLSVTGLGEDILDVLIPFVHLRDLELFRVTCTLLDGLIAGWLTRRLCSTLSFSFDHVAHLCARLTFDRVLISGSAATSMLLGSPSRPPDVDFYVPYRRFPAFVSYLEEVHGYTAYNGPADRPSGYYGKAASVSHVVRLRRSRSRIDIVRSISTHAAHPIPSFWSTVQMNFVTPSSYCIAYPSLTCASLGLLNPARVPDVLHMDKHCIGLLAKYVSRGFDIRSTCYSWDNGCDCGPACAGADGPICANSPRFFGDRFCLQGRLLPLRTLTSSDSTVQMRDEVGWIRGGRSCSESDTDLFYTPDVYILSVCRV